MHNLSFLRGWVVFFSKKWHFFHAKLQFLRGWMLFLIVEVSESNFLVLYFFLTFICFRDVLKLKRYMGKKVQKKFLMGLKVW